MYIDLYVPPICIKNLKKVSSCNNGNSILEHFQNRIDDKNTCILYITKHQLKVHRIERHLTNIIQQFTS